jgi:hypothetical protein
MAGVRKTDETETEREADPEGLAYQLSPTATTTVGLLSSGLKT